MISDRLKNQKIRNNKLTVNFEKKYAVVGLIFFIILFISIIFFVFRGKNDVMRIIFFPKVTFASEITEKIYSGEERLMPYSGNPEKDLDLFINEIILGPIRPDHGEIIPKNTKLLTMVLDNDVLYLNLSGNCLIENENTILDIGEKINAIGSNIMYNFPGLKSVFILINGELPDLVSYYGDDTYNFSDGKNYKLDNIN